MTAEARAEPRSGPVVLAIVGAGHFLSHYYNICLPVLFPLLHKEFGASYASLGFLVTLFYAASGLGQVPLGFLVDRFGAVVVLVTGLTIEGGAVVLMGISPGYAALMALAFLAGVGNAVFHPADYAILSEKIREHWVGRAFSIHTFAGHLGSATGPVVIGLLLLVVSWRTTLIISGVAAVVVLAAAFVCWGDLQTRRSHTRTETAASEQSGRNSWSLLLTPPLLLMFLFFIATSLTSSGVQSFSVAAFHISQGITTTTAGSILSAYLFASALGVLGGGLIADHIERHDLIAVIVFTATAILMLLLGSIRLPIAMIAIIYTLIGLGQGAVRPARDMMVRAATPPGGIGKAFGFVSSGIATGGALAPVLFGWLVDLGDATWVFYSIGVFMLIGIASVTFTHRLTPQAA